MTSPSSAAATPRRLNFRWPKTAARGAEERWGKYPDWEEPSPCVLGGNPDLFRRSSSGCQRQVSDLVKPRPVCSVTMHGCTGIPVRPRSLPRCYEVLGLPDQAVLVVAGSIRAIS